MTTKEYFILALGFLGQGLFGIRMISQWIQSEKAGRVISPTVFWRTSLIASFIFMIYGILRHDAVIIFGQILSYFIYIRNLQLKNAWKSIHITLRVLAFILPPIIITIVFVDTDFIINLSAKNDFTKPIILAGAIGQALLNFRFIYQWYYSEKSKISVLPLGFWVISAIASFIVLAYALYRVDVVLLLAQSLGLIVYTRNIMLEKKIKTSE